MFQAIPLDVITAPNFWTELPDNRWVITDPNAQALWFHLHIEDSLGSRSYIPAAGSTMSVIFQRADAFAVDGIRLNRLQHETQTVTKAGVVNADDRSLWSISMTSADITGVVSGTVKFELTESGTTTTWIQNYFLKKTMTEAGF